MRKLMILIQWLLVTFTGGVLIMAMLLTFQGSALGCVLFFSAAVLVHIVNAIDAGYIKGDMDDSP